MVERVDAFLESKGEHVQVDGLNLFEQSVKSKGTHDSKEDDFFLGLKGDFARRTRNVLLPVLDQLAKLGGLHRIVAVRRLTQRGV